MMAVGNLQSFGFLSAIADSVGAQDQAVRLLISLLMGYPIGLIHRYTLYGKRPQFQHMFFTLTGLAIGYFNYQWEVLHSLFTTVVVYLILYYVGKQVYSVIIIFLSTMSYLLLGYYLSSTETYDINWTTAQCILTLRLIGLAFDVYDGRIPKEKQTNDVQKTAIDFTPTLLEVTAFSYFPGSYLIGPQYPIRRYLDFVAGKFTYTYGNGGVVLPKCVKPGIKCGVLGILYLGIYTMGTSYFPDDYLISTEYENIPFYKKFIILCLWGKISLYKYISFWLLADGICVITGLAYNGTTKYNTSKWDGCSSINLSMYERATKFEHLILSFNITTNLWVSRYIYKRLRFLGKRYISQMATMTFLSMWHGLHSGYYICFTMEFFIMYVEKDIENVLAKNETIMKYVSKSVLQPIKWILLKSYMLFFMGYSLVPFVLLSYDRWFKVYKSLHFVGHLIFLTWPLYSPLIKIVLQSKLHQKKIFSSGYQNLHRASKSSMNIATHDK